MSDPAIEASRRAFGALWPDQGDFEFNFDSGQRQWADSAAREALKPIREKHVAYEVGTPDGDRWLECISCCGQDWPCETAKLIYTTEELER